MAPEACSRRSRATPKPECHRRCGALWSSVTVIACGRAASLRLLDVTHTTLRTRQRHELRGSTTWPWCAIRISSNWVKAGSDSPAIRTAPGQPVDQVHRRPTPGHGLRSADAVHPASALAIDQLTTGQAAELRGSRDIPSGDVTPVGYLPRRARFRSTSAVDRNPVSASFSSKRARRLLRKLTGDSEASFRDDQLEVIQQLVDNRGRVLLVQRTGWGKSAVYFIATKMLRDAGLGPTLLVSPLLALMRNQIEAAARMGVEAVTINSSNQDDWDEVIQQIEDDEADIVLISPERLANQDFRSDVLPVIGRRCGLLVIDEAHCISDWGHDFRPDYRRLIRVLDLLPTGVPVLCCTATANDRVVADVTAQLGSEFESVRGPLGREGLRAARSCHPVAGGTLELAYIDPRTASGNRNRLLRNRSRHPARR